MLQANGCDRDSRSGHQICGQDMTSTTQSSLEFSVKRMGMKEGKFSLSVTIDAMKVRIQGPQGEMAIRNTDPGSSGLRRK
jgi:hypothetical protein